MKKSTLIYIGGGIAVLLIIVFGLQALLPGDGVTTNDAYVVADFSLVAPKISGLVDRVAVDDNQFVAQGQELVHLDDRDQRVALLASQAKLAAAQSLAVQASANLQRQDSLIDAAQATLQSDAAALYFAQENAARYRNLADGGAGTVEQQQQAGMQLRQAQATQAHDDAALATAKADLPVLRAASSNAAAGAQLAQAVMAAAQLDLSYADIKAPFAGMIGARGVRVGNYVNAGTSLLAVVPLQDAYVIANFQETQLRRVHAGQKVRIHVDALRGKDLTGHVQSLAPASGVTFSQIAPDNATGNFTKVVQRLPLKILLDAGQEPLGRLRVGMSVEATVETGT